MNEEYIFRNTNDSINEIFKPFWLNDTIYSISNHIESDIPWYETLDFSTKISLLSLIVAIISLIVSVIIFCVGFYISELIRRHNKSNEFKQYKQFIHEWVEKSNFNLEEYINSLEDFSEKVKVNTDLNIAPWRTSMIHLSEINKIPLEKFSDIYIWGHSEEKKEQNRKYLMNFLYQIEYLNKVEVLIKSVYDEYCINNNKIMDEWNSNYMQLLDFIGMCNAENMSPEEHYVYNNTTNKLAPLLKPDGSFSGIDRWENEFINPMLDILKPLPLTSHIIYQFIIYIRNMRIIKMKHDKLNQYNYVFNEYVVNLKHSQSIIKNAIEHFKNQEIKYFCK